MLQTLRSIVAVTFKKQKLHSHKRKAVTMRDFFFHIIARKRNALGVRSEFSGYRESVSESEVLANLYTTYEHITVLEIRERKPWRATT